MRERNLYPARATKPRFCLNVEDIGGGFLETNEYGCFSAGKVGGLGLGFTIVSNAGWLRKLAAKAPRSQISRTIPEGPIPHIFRCDDSKWATRGGEDMAVLR